MFSRSSSTWQRRAAVGGLSVAVLTATGFAASSGAFASSAAKPILVKAATVRTGAVAEPLTERIAGATFATPPTLAACEKDYHLACYGPAQFRDAYNLAPVYHAGYTGKGETIAIVDSFGSPSVVADVAAFDKAYKLPAAHITVIAPVGKIPPFNQNNTDVSGWAFETDLDVEYAHAMAPGANLLLVETPVSEVEGTTGFPQIVAAEEYVITHHLADVISQSFGASEATFATPASLLALRGAYIEAAADGVTVLGASGDSGSTDACDASGALYCLTPTSSWPSTDPLVTSVGGLQLHLTQGGNTIAPPSTWNDTPLFNSPAASAGGHSVIFARPSYQNGVISTVGAVRGVPDISMSAAVDGGAVVYVGAGINAPGSPAEFTFVGGTSEATPQFSGIVALADQEAGHSLGPINPTIYKLLAHHAPGLVDVTSGTNTVTFLQGGKEHTVPGFDAVVGYDLATGVGGINAADFVPELAGAT